MRVPKALIGKEVKIHWHDPCGGERKLIKEAQVGLASLCYWIERGVIDDVTEGIVRIRQSEAFTDRALPPDEAIFSHIPEALIEKIEIGEFKELAKGGDET